MAPELSHLQSFVSSARAKKCSEGFGRWPRVYSCFSSLLSRAVHSVTLLLNLLACLAWFTVQTERGVDFGLSILWFVLFTPCAFLCWYRPIYKAFRQVLVSSVTGT